MGPKMKPSYDEDSETPEEGEDEAPESGPGEDDHLTICGRAIREAVASGDDKAIGSAIRSAVQRYSGDEDEEEAEDTEGSKPNLAALLMGKERKGGKGRKEY
jgi:hypothetical protein